MLTKILLLYLLLLYVYKCIPLEHESEEIVTLPNGKIQGHFLKTLNNNTYLGFQEIPYASPPIGELRFKDPLPPKNWEGVLNTKKNTKICYQSIEKDLENEDCLYLNVYSPVDKNMSKVRGLPVLIYIYGGQFAKGDGTFESLGPDFFIDQNIVVVTFNYRLKFFGFLSTQDNVISGNQGLKDQNLALKWVNTNIHLFGGDPSKVTIMGESAGAASVGYHLISTKSKGLFRAAILDSGTPLDWWAYQKRSKTIAYQLAATFEASFTENNSSEELLKLLQTVPAEDLKDAVIPGFPDMGIKIGQGYLWAPVIELDNEDSFITEFMDESIKNGNGSHVPLIIGVNSEELITLAENLTSFKNEMAKFDENLSLLVSEDFNINNFDLPSAGQDLRSIYTNTTFEDNLGAAIRFRSDARYTTSVIRHADLHSKYTDVFFYQFSHDGEMGGKNSVHLDGADSVAHAEDIQYFWRNSQNEDLSKFPEMDIITHHRLVKLWANFVKYLNPTPTKEKLLQCITWPPVRHGDFKYLNINDTLTVKTDPKEYKKWKKIVDTYGHPPFITY